MALIEDIKNDLEAGVVKMIHEYRDVLFAEAVRLLNDRHEAEDLVFRVFETILAKIDTYNAEKGSFLSWAKGIMRNEATLMRRGKVANATIPVDPAELRAQMSEVDDSTEKEILLHSDSELLHEAFKMLPKEMQDAMFLHYVSDLSIAEVAKLLKVQPGTVKMRLHRARKFLLHRLEAKMKGKKPLAVLAAVLFGAGALFGAWQAGVAIVESMSEAESTPEVESVSEVESTPEVEPTPEVGAVSMTPPAVEITLTPTKQEKTPMKRIKTALLSAASALTLMTSASAAVNLDEIQARLVPETGVTDLSQDKTKGEISYKFGDENIIIFATPGEHSFTVIPGISKLDYLVVAGGGSGGSCQKKASGGGGAGGMLTGVWGVDDGDELKIKVGAGATVPTSTQLPGNDGGNSFISNLVNQVGILTIGGGGGGYDKYTRNDKGEHTTTGGTSGKAPGFLGGSGGGAGGSGISIDSPGGACEEGQGNMGGSTLTYSGSKNRGGAGGGGAGGPGADSGKNQNLPGKGGDGVVCDITGRKVGYAAGGGGGIASSGTTPASGGSVVIVDGEAPIVIGGNGATTGAVGGDGPDGTGSGGGGGSNAKKGGNGGSGIVILRYQVKDPRTLTVTPNEGYQVSLDGVTFSDAISIDKYPESEITITAKKSDDGTATYEWSGYPEGAVINMDTITFTMPDNDVAITVVGSSAAAAKLTASVRPAEGGSITADPYADDGNYAVGTPVELTAMPNEHYYFSSWTVDGESAGAGNPLQLTMDADKSVVANFVAIPQKTLSVLAEGPGSVGGTEAGEYDEGTSVTLTATANTDCDFIGWTTNGVPAGSEAELSFELWSDVAVVATFQAKPRYSVTVPKSDFGSVTIQTTAVKDAEGKYAKGSELTFTPKPKSGLLFAGWIVNDEPAGTDNPLTITLEDDLTVQAIFGYRLTMNILGGGMVQGATNGQVIEANTAVTLTAVPNEDGAFLNWAGAVSGTAVSVSVTMDGAKSITAYFKDGTTGRCYFEGGWSNTVKTAKGGTEYVVAYTKVGEHTFKVPKGVDALSYLVVAGGGSGASGVNNGGGGGAGGVLTNTAPYAVSAGDVLSITVGAGGIVPTSAGAGVNGGSSSLNDIVAEGGGGGGNSDGPGSVGGSGGGAGGGGGGAVNGGAGTSGQGKAGGNHGWAGVSGAGGGGAGKEGDNGGSRDASSGAGGIGIESSISGISEYYAGGGGGGCYNSGEGGGIGGSGVGGQGGGKSPFGINGLPGLDGFGGGGGGSGAKGIGGNGGSGVVILRYKMKGGMMLIIR